MRVCLSSLAASAARPSGLRSLKRFGVWRAAGMCAPLHANPVTPGSWPNTGGNDGTAGRKEWRRFRRTSISGASDGVTTPRLATCCHAGLVAGAVDTGNYYRGRGRSDERDRNTCVRPDRISCAAWCLKRWAGSDAETHFRSLFGGPIVSAAQGFTNAVTVLSLF